MMSNGPSAIFSGCAIAWARSELLLAAGAAMPDGAEPVALLCIGPVHHFYEEPMLQQQRWAQRCALDNVLFEDAWGQPLSAGGTAGSGRGD